MIIIEMQSYDTRRERVIKDARDVTKQSKQAIYFMHDGKLEKALELLTLVESKITPLLAVSNETPGLRYGSLAGALEEYTEAKCFYTFLTIGSLLSRQEVHFCDRMEYLGGILDFTGEVARYAIQQATLRKVNRVRECQAIVSALDGQVFDYIWKS